jgi:hypothetical protein
MNFGRMKQIALEEQSHSLPHQLDRMARSLRMVPNIAAIMLSLKKS